MRIGEILDAVYDADVGWRPATGGIKPVHVANGLLRALQGEQHDTRRLHEFVVWWKQGKQPDEARTLEALCEAHPELYSAFTLTKDFDRVRRYADGLLNSDGALFPSIDHSSFSLTSGLMVTRDNSDRRLGVFGAAILGAPDDSSSLASAVLAASRRDQPRDPLSALVWPLLDPEPHAVAAGQGEAVAKALSRAHNRAFVESITEAARCLATHERVQGNHMRTLQRAVEFVCVATQAHAQALAAKGDLSKRPPALLALSGHRQSPLAAASERSFEALVRRFEEWLAQRLGELLKKGKSLTDGEEPLEADTKDGRRVRALFARIRGAGKGAPVPSDAVLRERMQHFTSARQLLGEDAEPAQIIASALVASYAREFDSGGPRRFLRVLGCRVGLLYPHFAGATRDKRYRPSVPVLDMLVRACVPAGQAVSLSEFLERLWQRFGVIVGGRRDEGWDDASFLAQRGVLIDTPSLVENTDALVRELAAMGLARRYADDVTFVGDGHE
ncbi:MAG: hypothetical protein IT378_15665 [Sandaracinaceae bacterium]|nr:hypothetical protein [Sandaracinaceae bacterium]